MLTLSNTCPQLPIIPKFVNNDSHHRRNIQTFNDLLLQHVLCAGAGPGRKFTQIRLTLTPVSMFTLRLTKSLHETFKQAAGLHWAGTGLAAAGSREMAASAAASAGCAVILEEASSEGEEGDPAAAPPPPSSAPPPPSLLHSLSVPGHVQDTPYHKLRRASHHIISGHRICFNCRAELTLLKTRFHCIVTVTAIRQSSFYR